MCSSVEHIPSGGYELWGDHECRRGLDSYKTAEMGETSVTLSRRICWSCEPHASQLSRGVNPFVTNRKE